jgi:katanin p60 ATPase-containing subunit A1
LLFSNFNLYRYVMEDMSAALRRISPSVSEKDVERHLEWLAEFGST